MNIKGEFIQRLRFDLFSDVLAFTRATWFQLKKFSASLHQGG
jgi:hypothetical protein